MKIKLFRLWEWFLLTAILLVIVHLIAPANTQVVVHKLSLVTLAAVLGYWLDRRIFYYARPDEVLGDGRRIAEIRRAIIIAACIIGVSLGL